jgi:hypothetical protein
VALDDDPATFDAQQSPPDIRDVGASSRFSSGACIETHAPEGDGL